MTRVDALLTDYGSYHRTRGNLICHAFGITLIVYGVLSLLLQIPLGGRGVSAAELLIAGSFFFYSFLSMPLALTVTAEAVALDLLARAVGDWRVGLAAFVVGWIFQGIGHARYERRSPAFFKNLVHLMVGPIFLWNEVLRVRRIDSLTH
jgi:uncharacterized membrane protein YGL010W